MHPYGKAPSPDGILNEMPKHPPEGLHHVNHNYLDVNGGNNAQGMAGISNSAPGYNGWQT